MNIIEVNDLSKVYKTHSRQGGIRGALKDMFAREYKYVEAVKDISFQIESGERIGFIGPNGAGKTTTLKMLTGLLYPSSGSASVMGYTPWQRRQEYLRKIGFLMGQKGQLLWDIPAYDSLLLNKEIYRLSETHFQQTVKNLSQIMEVEHLLKVPVRSLSLGQRMKMEIIASILHSPEILFLDEPTIGLDLTTQKNMRKFLAGQNHQSGTTMILTSHYMADIVSLCNRIIIINHGKIVFDNKIEELRRLCADKKTVRIQFETLPDDDVLQKYSEALKEKQDLQYVFQISQESVSGFLREMASLHPADISIEEPPIEDMIEQIYAEAV